MKDESEFVAAEKQCWDTFDVRPRVEWHDLPRTGCAVRVQVVGDGPPVVFLHGVNTGGTIWAPLATALPGFRCLLVDRPGCGLSEPLPDRITDVAAFAKLAETFTVELLDAMGLSRAPLVATSLGGYHAFRTAAAHPHRISALLQLGWTVGAPNDHLPMVMRLGGSRRLGRLMARLPMPKRAVRPLLKRIGLRGAVEDGRVSDEMVDWFHALLTQTSTMRNELDGSPRIITLRGLNESIVLPDDLLRRVQAPVQFVWGENDPFGDDEVARTFVSKLPTASLRTVAGAGHAVWFDDLATVRDHAVAVLSAAD